MTKFIFILLNICSLVLFVLWPSLANADRSGWNEPGRVAEFKDAGLLKVNKDYFDLSAETGGDFYFWAPGEFAANAGLLNVPIYSAPIALSYVNENEHFTHTQEVPVDSTISELSLFAGAQLLEDIRLLRPDGRTVKENPAGVSIQSFRHMHIITITEPEVGVWTVVFSGKGLFELAARYQADRSRLVERAIEGIDLLDFSFVELRGRPVHQGLFTVSASPQAGSVKRCLTTFAGGIDSPVIELISVDGEVLSVVDSTELVESSEDEFIGNCHVPDQPFRVQVRGRDAEGYLFQRVTSGLIHPANAVPKM